MIGMGLSFTGYRPGRGGTAWLPARGNEKVSGNVTVTALAAGAYGAVKKFSGLQVGETYTWQGTLAANSRGEAVWIRVSPEPTLSSDAGGATGETIISTPGTEFVLTGPATAETMYVGGIAIAEAAGDSFGISDLIGVF